MGESMKNEKHSPLSATFVKLAMTHQGKDDEHASARLFSVMNTATGKLLRQKVWLPLVDAGERAEFSGLKGGEKIQFEAVVFRGGWGFMFAEPRNVRMENK